MNTPISATPCASRLEKWFDRIAGCFAHFKFWQRFESWLLQARAVRWYATWLSRHKKGMMIVLVAECVLVLCLIIVALSISLLHPFGLVWKP